MAGLAVTYMNNIKDLIEELQNSEYSSMRQFGYHRIKIGEALMIEQTDFPMICISLTSIDNEFAGVGHQARRDAIYNIDISVYASEIMQDFQYEKFYEVLDELDNWLTLKAANIVFNVATNEKANAGLMPIVSTTSVAYEKKIIGDAFGMVVCGKIPIVIQSHRMRSMVAPKTAAQRKF